MPSEVIFMRRMASTYRATAAGGSKREGSNATVQRSGRSAAVRMRNRRGRDRVGAQLVL